MRQGKFWLGMLVSVVAIVLSARRIDIGEAQQAFHDAAYPWLIPAAAFSFLSNVFRTARWQALLYPVRVRFGRMFGMMAIGQAITTLLPLRLGDVARVYLLGDLERRSKVWALSTIVVERLLDIVTLAVIVVLLIPFAPVPDWATGAVWFAGAGMLTLLILLAVVVVMRERFTRLIVPVQQRIPERLTLRVSLLTSSAIDGLAVLGKPSAILRAAAWSGLTWIAGGLVMWMTLIAFDLPHSFSIAMMLLVLSAVAIALPSSPGFVGVYHAVVIESLALVADVSRSTAASFAVTSHILLFGPPVICGIAYLWRSPQIWDRLVSMRRSGTQPEPARYEEPATSLSPGQ